MNYSAALYMRISKEDGRGESASIGSQRALLFDFAKEKGFKVFGEYADDGFSGTNFERPAFKKMIDDIENGKINLVITKDLSRLGRDYITAGEYAEIYFPSKGVRFIAVNDGYDSEGPFADFIPFKNIVNEMYARDISRKIRSALYARMKKGDFVGAFPPFGYKRSEKNKYRLEPDPGAEETVRKIFLLAAKGAAPKKIAGMLDDEGIKTPLEYRKKQQKTKNWNSATILKIIHNPVYIGHTVQGKTEKISFRSKISVPVEAEKQKVVFNTHEPIIDGETFKEANIRKRKR